MGFRILNRDGTFNINRNKTRHLFNDTYHVMLSMSWPKFLFLYVAFYIFVNLFFACGFFVLGPSALEGTTLNGTFGYFIESFFFSVQTFGTIGFGKLAPIGLGANLLVTFESMTGLLSVAAATGIIFARFSRPISKVIFSEVAIVNLQDGIPCLSFRMANARLNQITEAEVSVVLVISETTKEGESYRNFYDLILERSHSPLFALTWTILHPIDDKSPLRSHTKETLEKANAEILVNFNGVDETLNGNIRSRFSYAPSDILWNYRFEDMLSRTPSGNVNLHVEKIHSAVPLSI